ncbi:MAG: sigma-70 family RNA polymerase sigma factor [Bacteroidia bacterium]
MFGPKSAYQESQVLEAIRAGGRGRQEAEYQLFDRFRYLVQKGKKRHGLGDDQVIDAYTDAVMAVIDKIASGSFRAENKISTLLHQVFFNKCVDVFRKESNTPAKTGLEEVMALLPDRTGDVLQRLMVEEKMAALRGLMENLGESCKTILWDSLYFGYRPAEIAEKLGLKNAETVLSQKSRCLKKLRSLAAEMNNEQ